VTAWPRRILLLEDSPSQALRLRLILCRAGYWVEIARDGAEGWRQACETSPQLILLDVDLPPLSGFQVLSRLKRGRTTAGIPVVMLTDREHIGDVELAFRRGADDYLPKRDAILQLCSVIEQQLS